MPESNTNEKTEPKVNEAKPVPCLHDVRLFAKVMPLSMEPHLLKNAKKFFPTCPYMAIAGSKYCRPHTVMNGAVDTPELERDINKWQEDTIRHFANGYLFIHQGTLYREHTYPHRFCTNGTPHQS